MIKAMIRDNYMHQVIEVSPFFRVDWSTNQSFKFFFCPKWPQAFYWQYWVKTFLERF